MVFALHTRTYDKIGPLFADNEHIAEILFRALKSHVPGEPVFFDTPEINPKAVALAERHKLNVVFRTVRMYTNVIFLPQFGHFGAYLFTFVISTSRRLSLKMSGCIS